MHINPFSFLFAAVVALSVSEVHALADRVNLPTYPLPGNGNFEIIASGSGSAERVWCAAGDYTLGKLRKGSTTRIYILNPRGPSQTQPGRTAIAFTVNPSPELKQAAEKLGQSFSLTVDKVGFNRSAGNTRSFCTFTTR